MLAIHRNCREPLRRFIQQMLEQNDSQGRVACIIYDALMHFAQEVAAQLNLPSINVRTSAAASMLAFAALPRANEQGYITFTGKFELGSLSKRFTHGTSTIQNQKLMLELLLIWQIL